MSPEAQMEPEATTTSEEEIITVVDERHLKALQELTIEILDKYIDTCHLFTDVCSLGGEQRRRDHENVRDRGEEYRRRLAEAAGYDIKDVPALKNSDQFTW